MQWRQLDNMQAICILVQTDNHTTTSSLSFYRLVALCDTKLTVSNTEGIEKGILIEKKQLLQSSNLLFNIYSTSG